MIFCYVRVFICVPGPPQQNLPNRKWPFSKWFVIFEHLIPLTRKAITIFNRNKKKNNNNDEQTLNMQILHREHFFSSLLLMYHFLLLNTWRCKYRKHAEQKRNHTNCVKSAGTGLTSCIVYLTFHGDDDERQQRQRQRRMGKHTCLVLINGNSASKIDRHQLK